MEVNYTYAKFRKEFGRQCRFSDHGPTMVINVMPNPSLDEQWILKNPVNQSTNKSVHWSAHEANTEVVDFADRGILHTEGGWPKDVNIDDPEQVVRFRKKAEKDETYLESVMKMSLVAEHAINQNNAIDIYQSYFTDPSCRKEETLIPSFQTVAVMSDPCDPIRPVQHLSWSPEDNLVAVSYADMAFQAANPANSPDSYIFNLESNTPYFSIESPNPIVTLEFNHRDAQCLAGGLMSGQVAYWDIRKGSENVAISNLRHGHRDPVKSLYWIHSKTSTEFYTGSSDGQVMWWDTRKLTEPTEVLILDLSVNENSDEPEWSRQARTHGVTCMDYDSSIPIRFMIGTETGLVFNGNRKGKTVLEKVSGIYNCHHGPVYSAQRNPVYSKNFLTVGDWQVRIWSEDIKDSPIMWTKHHDVRLTDGAWSETKPSVFYTTRADGCLECWDLLQKQNEPILTIKIADKELKCIKCHEDGALLAVGDECGKTYVVEMNDWFVVPGKTDKALLMAMFDRETKREKIIESKLRELRLKAKTSAKPDTETNQEKHALLVEAETRLIAEAEKEFDELVAKLNKKLTNDDEDELGREIADELQDRTVDQ